MPQEWHHRLAGPRSAATICVVRLLPQVGQECSLLVIRVSVPESALAMGVSHHSYSLPEHGATDYGQPA